MAWIRRVYYVLPYAGFTTALRRVWALSLVMGAYAGLALLVQRRLDIRVAVVPNLAEVVLGLALASLLIFRINRSYERWWEARTLWGRLVNVSRNLAIKIRILANPDDNERDEACRLIVGFSEALKDHLRAGASLAAVPGFENAAADPGHVPVYLCDRIYVMLRDWRAAGRLSDADLWILDQEARELLEVCGGCERIRNTLMSRSWRAFVRQCIMIFLLSLPWSLLDEYGIWTIPLSVITCYVIFGGEGIALQVEEPFKTTEDHLQLERICNAIERSVTEVLQRA